MRYLIFFGLLLIIPFIISSVIGIVSYFKRKKKNRQKWDIKRRREYADAVALCRIGESYLNKNMYSRAIDAELKALEYDPHLAHAYKILGKSYYKLGRIQEALRALEKCLEIDAEQADVQTERGICYYSIDSYDTARRCYETALTINPNYDKAYFMLAKVLAEVYMQYNEAINLLKKFLSLVPLSKQANEAKELIREYTKRSA